MKAVTHLEKVIAGETSAVTHLEKVIAQETTAVTYTEKVIAGTAPPVTHLQKVIAGVANPVTHLEYVWAGGSPPSEQEYTGAVPVTFVADGTPLLDYIISGNTVQSGTPTPDSPVMPEGTGERTGNLLQIPDAAETTKNGVTYHVKGNSLYIDGTSTAAFGINIRNAFTLKAGTYTNQMYGFTGRRIYYSFNNVSATMCTSDVNLYKTFTIAEDTTYANALVWINNGVTFNNEKIDFALFESEVPKDFEPYGFKIPISSANTTTPVYLGEVETTRKIRKVVFDGTENLASGSVIGQISYTIPQSPCIPSTGLCSHYIIKASVTAPFNFVRISYASYNNGTIIWFELERDQYPTKEEAVVDFKSYLAQQYANGTPVCVWYVLANEETAVVNEPLMRIGDYADTLSMEQAGVQIPTANGSTTMDVETTVKPSEIYIKYRGEAVATVSTLSAEVSSPEATPAEENPEETEEEENGSEDVSLQHEFEAIE